MSTILNEWFITYIYRAATGGKTAKAWYVDGFWEIENDGGIGGVLVKWPPVITWPLQQKLIKTVQNEAIVPLITKNALICPSDLFI